MVGLGYNAYTDLHAEVNGAVNCPKSDELLAKINEVVRILDGMELAWYDLVENNFREFKNSLVTFLENISKNVGSNLSIAEDTYSDLKNILDEWKAANDICNKMKANKPAPYVFKPSGKYDSSGKEIYETIENDEYIQWQAKIADLENKFTEWNIEVITKKEILNNINENTIIDSLASDGISTEVPIFEMPEDPGIDGIPASDGSYEGNRDYIMQYLKYCGLTDAGIAGLMGNLQAESVLFSNNLENSKEGKYNDDSYTRAVDDGSISKETFVKDRKGYGLAQWTWPSRKQKLYEFCKEKGTSISDLRSQLDFLTYELQNDYPSVWKKLTTSNDLKDCTETVLMKFEKPKTPNLSSRIKDARKFI